MLLNAYGWWTVATIALWAGVAMLIAGLLHGDLLDPRVQAREEGVVTTAEFSAVETKSLVGSTV